MPAEPDDLIYRLAVGDAEAIADIVQRAQVCDDVTTLVSAALFAPDAADLLQRAASRARTTRDRQIVAIAVAHAAGDVDLVDALARDHLTDHPSSVLVAWISARTQSNTRTQRGSDVSHLTAPPVQTSSIDHHRRRGSFRPWWRWLLTALAFPPAGLIAHVVAGRVDSVEGAVLNGVIAGAGIGTVQWALLRHRHVGGAWIVATAVGLGTGLPVGAALVSYRTDITSLAVMGAISGLGVGFAQGATFGNVSRAFRWSAATAALFALGWTVTTAIGIDVSQQWAVFGAAGCLTLAFLQSTFIDAFVPAAPRLQPSKVTS